MKGRRRDEKSVTKDTVVLLSPRRIASGRCEFAIGSRYHGKGRFGARGPYAIPAIFNQRAAGAYIRCNGEERIFL